MKKIEEVFSVVATAGREAPSQLLECYLRAAAVKSLLAGLLRCVAENFPSYCAGYEAVSASISSFQCGWTRLMLDRECIVEWKSK
ncbi:hypothetical protein VIGAN_03059000 [Vigna angularis var. angularis]|uniref:Uncharacterized protein n=1 Tax=Vigna angularis var. angularis TaxID=157739 RepID=A0A0S3RK75_PHAAN|nr:hypothetical protein VIGAN_03058800 [Vigna angularis var. angularis]BAT80960.1 hypothetical protein VIGAN_03059000 [Vigna angularis var. angularis]